MKLVTPPHHIRVNVPTEPVAFARTIAQLERAGLKPETFISDAGAHKDVFVDVEVADKVFPGGAEALLALAKSGGDDTALDPPELEGLAPKKLTWAQVFIGRHNMSTARADDLLNTAIETLNERRVTRWEDGKEQAWCAHPHRASQTFEDFGMRARLEQLTRDLSRALSAGTLAAASPEVFDDFKARLARWLEAHVGAETRLIEGPQTLGFALQGHASEEEKILIDLAKALHRGGAKHVIVFRELSHVALSFGPEHRRREYAQTLLSGHDLP